MNAIALKKSELLKTFDPVSIPKPESTYQERRIFWVQFILTNLDMIREEIESNIDTQVLKDTVGSLFFPIEEIVLALSDANPDNKGQIDLILKEYVNSKVSALLDTYSIELTNKIQDKTVRELASIFVTPTVSTLRALSDDNQNNEAQLKEIWLDNLVKDRESQERVFNSIIIPFVDKLAEKSKFGRLAKQAINIISLIIFGIK